MLNIKKLNLTVSSLKLFKTKKYIIFNRNVRWAVFNIPKYVIIHSGNRFVRKTLNIVCLNTLSGQYGLTKKPFAKPINKLKIKL